jgi:peptidylprolyl isomerase
VRFQLRPAAAALVVAVLALTACGSSGHSHSASSSPAGTGSTGLGVRVDGAFGSKPTLTIPDRGAPTSLQKQVISQGSGAVVAKGDTLVANYVGQTWAAKSGKPNVFDSSFERGKPAAFVIGVGRVIPGWDKTLVGQKIGSRLLLSIPPADGYGASGQSAANISGTDTLVFVVDVLATYKPNASAPGTPVKELPTTDFPRITNISGKPPTILSTAGVKAPKKPVATLVETGLGATIDANKSLVLQIVQTDLATGKSTQSSWGSAPQVVDASSVLSIATVLRGQKIGSRAVVLAPAIAATPATASQQAQLATPAEILIVDVVGQF